MRTLPLVLAAAVTVLGASSSGAKVTRYLTGNAADVSPTLFGPAHDFGGGSTDVDAAIQWLIDQAPAAPPAPPRWTSSSCAPREPTVTTTPSTP